MDNLTKITLDPLRPDLVLARGRARHRFDAIKNKTRAQEEHCKLVMDSLNEIIKIIDFASWESGLWGDE